MFGISAPPMPGFTPMFACGLSAALVAVGAALILWGRHLHRAALAAVGIASGLGVGWMVADRFPLGLTATRLVSAAALGLMGLMLARLAWAILAGAVFATAAGIAILHMSMNNIAQEQMPVFQEGASTLVQWTRSALRFFTEGLTVLWNWNPTLVGATVGLAGIVPLAALLVRARLGRIVMTSMVGGAASVAGAILSAVQVSPSLWQWAWQYWQCPVAAIGLLTTAGVTVQYRAAIQADRDEAERQAELDQDEEDDDGPAPKKKRRRNKK